MGNDDNEDTVRKETLVETLGEILAETLKTIYKTQK
jgi:hypothetical protein